MLMAIWMVTMKWMCCSPDAMQKSSALFLLRLKEKHKLTQVTVQSIVDNVTTLTQQRISSLKLQVATHDQACNQTFLEGSSKSGMVTHK